MAQQVQRYGINGYGQRDKNDRGVWCLWEDVAPYIKETCQAEILLLAEQSRDWLRCDTPSISYALERIDAIVAKLSAV